ncbi:MAG: bifunctional diguanylate cyclase/phosphodiesterase [Gammaproteobacteria bacterium]
MEWYGKWFQIGQIPENALYGSYNYSLVFLSYVIAVLASYVALDVSSQLRRQTKRSAFAYWLVGGAFAMGAGIWAMHFIGMLAFVLPKTMQMTYDFLWTGLSMIAAILTASIALCFFRLKQPQPKHYLTSGIVLGSAIPTMHYLGMTGMNNVTIRYLPWVFSLSILIAIVAASVALWLAVHSDKGSFKQRVRLRFGSALIMGLAIAGMHYTGMAGTVFTQKATEMTGFSLDPTGLSVSIGTVGICILIVALIVTTAKYFFSLVQQEKEFLGAILKNMKDGVMVCDPVGSLTMFNRTTEELYGPLVAQHPEKWVKAYPLHEPGTNLPLALEKHPLNCALRGEKVKGVEVVAFAKSGNPRNLLMDGQLLRGSEDDKLGAVVVFHDITERKKMEDHLKHQATHDPLTNLPNRVLLTDRLNQEIARASRNRSFVAVLFFDLDRFKNINDSLGHDVGDLLLQAVASLISNSIRKTDTLARLGGDEFILVIPVKKHEEIIPVVTKILNLFTKPLNIASREFNISTSIGISVYPTTQDISSLLKNADLAMYQAKGKGGATYQFFDASMHLEATTRLELENQLHGALARDEFILHYQPIIDSQTKRIAGFEALVRWQHPTKGLVPPLDFIPVAETTGLITPIGEWVLRTACTTISEISGLVSYPLQLAVNISPSQFHRHDMAESIAQVLKETNFPPEHLDLELTESIFMEPSERILKMFQKLAGMGVSLVIDDFGTGYSNLSYLKRFKIGKIKIDKSFVRDLIKDSADMALIMGMVTMAHALGLRVVAEGTETQEQVGLLGTTKCNELQGYYFGSPKPIEHWYEYFQKQRRCGRL